MNLNHHGRINKERQQQFSWLPTAVVTQYARAYGSCADQLLENCKVLADMGHEILPGLFEVEIRYWMEKEWAVTAEDMLWRRSKLGLHVGPECAAVLEDWIRRLALKP